MTHLVQLQNGSMRRVAVVEEPRLRLLAPEVGSVYALALMAIKSAKKLTELVHEKITNETLDYEAIYKGSSPWKLLPPLDHPDEPARCLVSGTGLTHLGSAKDRNAMHAKQLPTSNAQHPTSNVKAKVGASDPGQKEFQTEPPKESHTESPREPQKEPTDSMKMFQLGVEQGKPGSGNVGAAPEWFYKGNGAILRAPGEALLIPSYAEDGGEEAEVAGCYIIAPDGRPWRVGFAVGNEFSDHVFEKKNYLNLAGSKIRTCALGPELVIAPEFSSVPGEVAIERAGRVLWTKAIATGEAEMCHSLQNIEHHHFKFETHRRAGDVHVHYFGACALSFGDGIRLADGDIMRVQFAGFGRALRNPVKLIPPPPALTAVASMA